MNTTNVSAGTIKNRGKRKQHRPASTIELGDALELYANPAPDSDALVTLVKPPIVFSKNSYSTPLTQPIGLAYLAAVLEKARYPVAILDCPGADPDRIALTGDRRFKVQGLDWAAALDRIDPRTDIVGVTIMFSQEWPYVRDLILRLRARFPRVAIIAGGEHVTALPAFSMRDCPAIDYAVTGEGELAFLELVRRLRGGQRAEPVAGVLRRGSDGQIVPAELAPRMGHIEALPWPAWHLIDVRAYFKPNFTMGISHGRNMAIVATRGCPYQCTFCSNPSMWTTRYVMRPPADVADEIEHDIATYDCNAVDFYDLTAIVKKKWILDFAAELERRRMKITWQLPSGTRSESIDDEVIEATARNGLRFVVYAPESGSTRTLERIKKRVDLHNLERSIRSAVRHRLVCKVNFIIGFPFERRRDIWKTLLFVWKLALQKVDDCNISAFSPYPGSELYDELLESGEIPPPDDAYFQDLITQFDFTVQKTICRHVGAVELLLYRVLGMGGFYALGYLRCPGRIGRLLLMLIGRRAVIPRSLFEQRLLDALARRRSHARTRVRMPTT